MTTQQLSSIEFGQITPSKREIANLSNNISEGVAAGFLDPIDTAIILNAIKQVCEEALALIRKPVVDSLEENNGKVDKFGVKIEKAELGVKYDYSNNVSWVDAKNAEDSAAEKRKELEKILKTIPPGKEIFDGDGNQLIGPAKTSTTGFKTTLPK